MLRRPTSTCSHDTPTVKPRCPTLTLNRIQLPGAILQNDLGGATDGVIGRRSASSRGRTSGKALDHSPAACSSGQQAVLNRVRGCCCPGVDADLGEDVADVAMEGASSASS